MISVRISATHVRIVAEGNSIAEHERLLGRNQLACQPWHYVPILETKPGALRHGQPFIEWQRPLAIERVRTFLLKQPKGDRAFADIRLQPDLNMPDIQYHLHTWRHPYKQGLVKVA